MRLLHRLKGMLNWNARIHRWWVAVKPIVNMYPLYVVQEGCFEECDLGIKPELDHCTVGFLEPSDVGALAAHPEVSESQDGLVKRLADGCLCLGIKHEGKIAGYTWVNLSRYPSKLLPFPLRRNEAYLFDARTFQAYRGKNLAPYLRYELYKRLEEIGRERLFSVTEGFNTAAMNFKKKLRAKPVRLYLRVTLLRRHEFNILLKDYGLKDS